MVVELCSSYKNKNTDLMLDSILALFGGSGKKADKSAQVDQRQIFDLPQSRASTPPTGDVIEANQYADKGELENLGLTITSTVDAGPSLDTGVLVRRLHGDRVGFDITRVEALAPEGFKFSNQQRLWIGELVIPGERQRLRVPQILFETIRLYADLAIEVDSHLKSQGSDLAKLWARLSREGGYYDNLLYTLECLAEHYIVFHYDNKPIGNDANFSFGLLQERVGEAGILAVKGAIGRHLHQLPPVSPDTIEGLGLNDRGLKPVWWDKTGELRQVNKPAGRWLHLLNSLGHRSNVKFLDDEQMKFATVKIYFCVVQSLLKADAIEGVSQPKYLADLADGLKSADQSPHPAFNLYSEYDTEILTSIFKLVENAVRRSYYHRLGPQTLKAEKSLRQILGQQWFDQTKVLIKQHRLAELPKLPWSNSWKPALQRLEEVTTADNFRERLVEAKQLVKTWREADCRAEIYYGLSLIFAHHHPVAASFYFYKHSSSSAGQVKELTPQQRQQMFGSNQRWQSFKSLMEQKISMDETLWEAIKGLFPDTQRRQVVIDHSRQAEIRQQNDRTREVLEEYIGEVEEEVSSVVGSSVEMDSSESLSDIFETSESIGEGLVLDPNQLGVLRLFVDNNGSLTQQQLDSFARDRQIMPTSLMSQLNQLFIDHHDIDLIIRTGQVYQLDDAARSLIVHLI